MELNWIAYILVQSLELYISLSCSFSIHLFFQCLANSLLPIHLQGFGLNQRALMTKDMDLFLPSGKVFVSMKMVVSLAIGPLMISFFMIVNYRIYMFIYTWFFFVQDTSRNLSNLDSFCYREANQTTDFLAAKWASCPILLCRYSFRLLIKRLVRINLVFFPYEKNDFLL